MSHVTTVDVDIRDMDALVEACHRCGLQLVVNQKTYRWYGESVGDYPLPAGFTAEDLGKCEHAIRVPGDANAYEIGVVRRRDGRQGFTLMYDFWQGGFGIEQKSGVACGKLRQAYTAVVARKAAMAQGFQVQEQRLANGSVRMVLTKP